MSNIISNFDDGTIKLSEVYNISSEPSAIDATPYFNNIGEEYTTYFIQLNRVKSFSSLTFQTIGTLQTRYLEPTYRISRNGTAWSNFYSFEEISTSQTVTTNNSLTYSVTQTNYVISNFPPFDPLDQMWIDIKFKRTGSKSDGTIRLVSFEIDGEVLRNSTDGTALINSGGEVIIKPPFIYKIFKIDDIEIVSPSDVSGLNIQYRFSQDNSKTWSNWEPLTKENISTKRINSIRFFQIEYKVTNNGQSAVKLQDINLIGDFQNVTADSQKTNIYGIRDCCQSFLLAAGSNGSNAGAYDANGNFIANTTGALDAVTCQNNNVYTPLTTDEKSKLYNPYQQVAAVNLLNQLSNDANEIFGHAVKYLVTDPDGKGIDYTLHEEQLFNIVCEGDIKVSVDGNQFPDNQITMNQFDLNLFESFEIHIPKDSFKSVFGVQRRPSKEDIVYFCELSRLFIVDHAQQFRNFNNYAIYWKVVLRKYNKSSNVKAGEQSIQDRINMLTNNSTIDQLMGIENKQDKASTANLPQLQPLTRDPIRVAITGIETNTLIVKELIENSTTIISKQHYDFSNALIGGQFNSVNAVVQYKNIDNPLKVSDNIGFFLWFRLNNYLENENYNFFNYYDSSNSLGWKVNLNNDVISVNLNGDTYNWSLTGHSGTSGLYENVWYCYVLNVDQRQRQLEQWIYKRNVESDSEDDAKYLSSTVLEDVYTDMRVMTPVEYEITETNAEILISDMCATNIRLFTDIIPQSDHTKILNQYLVGNDSKYLVFADNANLKLSLPNFPYNGEGFDKNN